MSDTWRQCRRTKRCRARLPGDQLIRNDAGAWVCIPNACPLGYEHEHQDPVFLVQKRWLNVAKIMFLTSSDDQQDPDELVENLASRIEELTEEIVDFSIECHELNGGYISHSIQGAELVPKKVTKHRFRRQIFEHWDHRCAYCGQDANTLDHVIPRKHGGLTVRGNLVACCCRCNGAKGSNPIFAWYRQQPFWDGFRELAIAEWCELEPPEDEED